MKKNEIFEAILTASCELNEQQKEVVMSKLRNVELVDTRVMVVMLMKKYGMSDFFIAEKFHRTRQWVSFARNLFNIRYSTCWNFRSVYHELVNEVASKYPTN
jgi:hypothetical protein